MLSGKDVKKFNLNLLSETSSRMITVHTKDSNDVVKNAPLELFDSLPESRALWIDLKHPTEKERKKVESYSKTNLLTREQSEEIESTSKYSETPTEIISNTNYFVKNGSTFTVEPVSFIITDSGLLLSTHNLQIDSFNTLDRRLDVNMRACTTGYHMFITILEAKIDYDADMVEYVSSKITELNKKITESDSIDKKIIKSISELQGNVMSLRENIYDLERVLSGIRKSVKFPKDIMGRVELMIQDVNSLISHSDFSFERLDYMQETAMGLINIEQNEIVKILSVAAVIFMPPTLVASIYGMNFKYMPELNWEFTLANGWIVPAGYIFALMLMLLFTLLTLWFFRYKKWM